MGDVEIERAHRDGYKRDAPSTSRHMLVKLLISQRQKLEGCDIYITDDHTKTDLEEKRKHSAVPLSKRNQAALLCWKVEKYIETVNWPLSTTTTNEVPMTFEFLHAKNHRLILKPWLDWRHKRKHHVFRAWRDPTGSSTNLAEIGHSLWAKKGVDQLTLVTAAKEDAECILMTSEITSFADNLSIVNRNPVSVNDDINYNSIDSDHIHIPNSKTRSVDLPCVSVNSIFNV